MQLSVNQKSPISFELFTRPGNSEVGTFDIASAPVQTAAISTAEGLKHSAPYCFLVLFWGT